MGLTIQPLKTKIMFESMTLESRIVRLLLIMKIITIIIIIMIIITPNSSNHNNHNNSNKNDNDLAQRSAVSLGACACSLAAVCSPSWSGQ